MDLGKETGLEWFSGGDIQYILFKSYSDWHYFCPSLQVCWLPITFQICNLKDFECVLITVFPNTRHCRSAPQTHSLQTFDKLAHLGCFLMSGIPLWKDRSLDVWCWWGEVRLWAFWEKTQWSKQARVPDSSSAAAAFWWLTAALRCITATLWTAV